MREKISKLAQHITQRNKVYTETDPEYYVYADILTDEHADILLAMERRKEEKVEDIAAKVGKSYSETFDLLMELTDIGAIELKPQGDGSDRFELIIYLPGVFELMMLNREQAKAHPEIARAFEEYSRVSVEPVTQIMPMGNGALRVIPVESAIQSITRKAPYEELSHWLTKYQNHLALAPCQCRLVRQQMGEGTGNMPEEMCIILGATAESCIRTNKARRITKEEALEVLRVAEQRGYMHQVTNMDGTDKIWAICNCERNICFALRTSQYFGTPNMSRSNYIAQVDKEKCAACGQCVETCPANAVKLGQNLCTKTPVTYQPKPLPDDHNWGPERYNPEFRTNFENTHESGAAPCKATCPARVSVQGYIKLAAQGKYKEALELIKKENPFPAVCGRICPHNCEGECTRGQLDEAVAIDEIKKFIAEQELNLDQRFIPEKLFNYSDKKIAIIGGGPAGLSCAYYLSCKGYTVTVFEKEAQPGGMLMMGIPSYRLEKDVLMAEIDVLKQMGVEIRTGVEVGVDVTIPQLKEQGYDGFFLAIGAQGGRKLNIEGEDHVDVMAGVDFLKKVNLGEDIQTPGKVIVIGGGNVAIDVARTAVRSGANEVFMYCLESLEEMPAQKEEIAEAQEEKIQIENGWGPKRIVIENNKLVGVEFIRCVSVFNQDGKFDPKYDDQNCILVPADKVLLSVGQSIQWGTLLEGVDVEVRPNQAVVADPFTLQTKEATIFAGGDVVTGPKFAIDAIAAGKEGADSLHRAVQEGQDLRLGRNRRIFQILDKENVDFEGYDRFPRTKVTRESSKENTFQDPRRTFTKEEVERETKRCLECGVAVVDENQCLGCGECTVRCKFDAITLRKEYDAYSFGYENIKKHAIKRELGRKVKIALNPNRDSFEK